MTKFQCPWYGPGAMATQESGDNYIAQGHPVHGRQSNIVAQRVGDTSPLRKFHDNRHEHLPHGRYNRDEDQYRDVQFPNDLTNYRSVGEPEAESSQMSDGSYNVHKHHRIQQHDYARGRKVPEPTRQAEHRTMHTTQRNILCFTEMHHDNDIASDQYSNDVVSDQYGSVSQATGGIEPSVAATGGIEPSVAMVHRHGRVQ